MKNLGFIGGGKIGKALIAHVHEKNYASIVFVEDPVAEIEGENVVRSEDPELYAETDLIIECAMASVLKEKLADILKVTDLMMFSVTAFSDPEFVKQANDLTAEYGHHIYIPHGAILGIDGIYDGRNLWKEVFIQTIKSPKSLHLDNTEKEVVYQGSTRGACAAFPRNVNVHASTAMAGIGLDKTQSMIISDPSVSTNTHLITLHGDGIDITIKVSSYAQGAVTGVYTPTSACGSLDRILETDKPIQFV